MLTQALVIPPPLTFTESDEAEPGKGFPVRHDEEVEAIALDMAVRYEPARGWNPHDVSGDSAHYDIRSQSPKGEKRLVEVKGRAQVDAVVLTALTGPKLDKLRQLGDGPGYMSLPFAKVMSHG